MQKVAELDWSMKKALVEQSRDHTWELSLTNDDQWRTHLREHFEKIFYRQQQVTVTAKIRGILDQLTAQCKKTPWVPFSIEDLQAVKEKWKKGKSCGPDMVSHEAPKAILPHPTWGNRLLEIFNDMLYTICVVKSIETGATVVLAKITQPVTWGDTRPITLSSVLLKTFGQLLLRRAGDCESIPIQQSNGVRQGAPESPVAFGSVVAEDLDAAVIFAVWSSGRGTINGAIPFSECCVSLPERLHRILLRFYCVLKVRGN
eukprot:s4499_g6.t1